MARNSATKEDEIFAAAVRVFQQKGYHAASMEDIADAVGLQKPSLYHYISSKQELLLRVFERGAGAFTTRLADIVASDRSATDKLKEAIETHLLALCEQLELFTVYLRENKFLDGKEMAAMRAEGERHTMLLETIIAEGIRNGEFRRIDAKVTALAIVGMCNWLYQWYSPTGRLKPAAIASIYTDLVLSGLALPGQPQSHKGKK